jgi:hypothetical protein
MVKIIQVLRPFFTVLGIYHERSGRPYLLDKLDLKMISEVKTEE